MEIVATNLLIFSNFLDSRKINIVERIELKKYLSVAEIDELVRYAKQRFDRQKIINIKSASLVIEYTFFHATLSGYVD